MKNKLIALNLSLIAILVVLVVFKHEIVATGQISSVVASWYGFESCVNPSCLMANGEVFDEDEISCASRTHYGKVLEISYKGKTILCRVNDKNSKKYDATRVDISRAGFLELENLDKGIIQVVIR